MLGVPPREQHEQHDSRMRQMKSEPNMAAPACRVDRVDGCRRHARRLPQRRTALLRPSAHRPTASPTAGTVKREGRAAARCHSEGMKRRSDGAALIQCDGGLIGGGWRRQQEAGWGKGRSVRRGHSTTAYRWQLPCALRHCREPVHAAQKIASEGGDNGGRGEISSRNLIISMDAPSNVHVAFPPMPRDCWRLSDRWGPQKHDFLIDTGSADPAGGGGKVPKYRETSGEDMQASQRWWAGDCGRK
ncbi:hypothetical protein C8R47DRAFT_1080513 [Mycena vitilis]|nr:hypothetical protein C8R47DRAFT_1080513 [Mycena vitilis]